MFTCDVSLYHHFQGFKEAILPHFLPMFSPCFTRSLQLGIATCMQKICSTKQRMWCQFANIFMVICYIYFILVQDVVKVDLIMVDVYGHFQKSLPQPLFPK